MILTIDEPARTSAIPADFSGLSFETGVILRGTNGQYLFSPTNKPLISLFKTLGIRSLRIGGNTADLPAIAIPREPDIDTLFAFAKAAGVKVIYTLRLRNGGMTNDAVIARYIQQHYKSQLACFAIGNEPDYYKKVYPVISNYSTFRDQWKKFAAVVSAAVPGARFCGPCSGGATAWSRDFANDFAASGLIAWVTQHDYPGGSSRRTTNSAIARDKLLSPAWLDHYEKYYDGFASAALTNGLAYRLEEASNFSEGGVKGASDTFAAALWSLDYLHWWAAHDAGGINFHGRRWVPNCVIHPAAPGSSGCNVRPIGYGIKAFDLGGHGNVQPLTMANPDTNNLTAYAVRAGKDVFVTILNKEHGTGAREANVAIMAKGMSKTASVLFLQGDVATSTGVTLGGASIADDGSWHGNWTRLKSAQSGTCTVRVSAASAAIVKIRVPETLSVQPTRQAK